MATITQTTSIKSAIIWMGDCGEEECQDFDLSSYALGEANEGIVKFAYHLSGNSAGSSFKGDQPAIFNSLNGGQENNKLLCGKAYYIQLNAAIAGEEKTINLTGAVVSYADEEPKGRVFNKDSAKPQFLGDVSNLPSCIAKGQFKNLITDSEIGAEYTTAQEITADKDGIYIKPDGSVHRFFKDISFNIPAGSKLLKGNFGSIDTDGDGTPDIHDTEPSVSDRETYTGGGDSSTPIGPIDQDTLLESFKITLSTRPWTDLEFFWDPLTRKYNNKESNYDDWYIELDSASNTWKTYLIYNNEPTEADEISASINILNTNTDIIISDAVHLESPALPKSFVVTGGNIDNNAEGTYTLVFNSNSDFYYTNNNDGVEYQIKYDYDAKNWQAFSIHPINGSETFYKNVTNSGVKFLTEIVANEVIEMGSDLQRTYLNPDYASNAQTQDETITFNGRSLMTSDWTANSFVMPDCAKSLSQSYQFIPDSTGDFNLQRKQVASYYPVPPRNRSELYKVLAPSLTLGEFGIPLGFGNWDHSNFTTTKELFDNAQVRSEDFCPAPYGRNKIRITLRMMRPPPSTNGTMLRLDMAWDHYFKRYIARDLSADNNSQWGSAGVGISSASQYEPLLIPSKENPSSIENGFSGWHFVTEGDQSSNINWPVGFHDSPVGIPLYRATSFTYLPSHSGNLPNDFAYGATDLGGVDSILEEIVELSDHPTYSAERHYSDLLHVPEDILNYYWLELSFANIRTTNRTNPSLNFCGPARKGGTDPGSFSQYEDYKVLTDHPWSNKAGSYSPLALESWNSNGSCYPTHQNESTEINISNDIYDDVFLKNYTTDGWNINLFSKLSFVKLRSSSQFISFNITGPPIVDSEIYNTFPVTHSSSTNTGTWDWEETITLTLRGTPPS